MEVYLHSHTRLHGVVLKHRDKFTLLFTLFVLSLSLLPCSFIFDVHLQLSLLMRAVSSLVPLQQSVCVRVAIVTISTCTFLRPRVGGAL
jgi:hypothetical protein